MPAMANSVYRCVKHIFCWLNVILWISGSGLLGVGVWLKVAYEGYASLLPQYSLLGVDFLAIVIGSTIFVISFLACCGSWFRSKCMLVTYFGLVVFLFVAEFLCGSLAFIFRDSLRHVLKEELQIGLWHHYNITTKGPYSLVEIWDNLQSKFQCCGISSYQDWFMIDAWPSETWVPNSCCLNSTMSENCGKSGNPEDFFMMGCYDQIHMWFVQRLHIVGVAGLIIAFIQLFGLVSSMLLFSIKKRPKDTTWNPTIYKRV